jgi:glycosyltransferase involved in cell wall biosynthesis
VRDFTLHSRYGSETTVIGGVEGPGFAGIEYIALPKARWFENRTRGYARQALDAITQRHAALIEVHNRPSILCMLAGKTSARLALHLHNDAREMDDARTVAERKILVERCAGIYCVSEYIRARFLDGLPEAAAGKLHIVHNGITLPATHTPKEKLIVFAGRMTEDKGALPLAEALRIALPKLADWRAVMIGSRRFETSVQPSAYEQAVANTLAPLGGQVTLSGYIPHTEAMGYFARASIAVVPSLWQEPFGRTALEAMAHGAAVISSGRGGLKEVTADAALQVNDIAARPLADAIGQLASNETLRIQLRQAGETRAKNFSIAQVTQNLDDARALILKESSVHA